MNRLDRRQSFVLGDRLMSINAQVGLYDLSNLAAPVLKYPAQLTRPKVDVVSACTS